MQLEFFEIPSPCLGICQSNTKGNCMGCMRTRDERQGWINFSSNEKQKVLKRCQQRKKRLDNAKADGKSKKSVEAVTTVVQPSLLDSSNKKTVSNSSDLDFGDFEL